ncbi:MAG: hypothetical protein ABI629_08805 [bacterium]
MKYRRPKGHREWHCCMGCDRWPHVSYDETTAPAADEPLCGICETKVAVGSCTPQD